MESSATVERSVISINDYELIDEAMTDLSNKYNSSLINRQIGRLLAKLDVVVEDYCLTKILPNKKKQNANGTCGIRN